MTASRLPAIALCLAALATGDHARATEVATLPQASGCTARLPPFGGRGSSYLAPNGTIGMSNDGGWCWLQVGWTWRGAPATPSGRIRTPPSHGIVAMGPVDGGLRIAYRPSKGFTGHDLFRVRVVAPGQVNVIPVHVTVTP